MSFKDYLDLEKLMETFYSKGKLAKTGHGRGTTPGEDLSHQCTTIKMQDENDEIVYIFIESSPLGIGQLKVQTRTQPLLDIGYPEADRYAYVNSNWEKFEDDRNFYGLYGWTNGEKLAGLGFI